MTSSRVKPADARRAAAIGLVVQVPVADVGVYPFAARLTVRAQRVNINVAVLAGA
jgi:hypothetical protein